MGGSAFLRPSVCTRRHKANIPVFEDSSHTPSVPVFTGPAPYPSTRPTTLGEAVDERLIFRRGMNIQTLDRRTAPSEILDVIIPTFRISMRKNHDRDAFTMLEIIAQLELGESWVRTFAQWVADEREANAAVLVSSIFSKVRDKGELALMMGWFSDVWSQLAEFDVPGRLRRALSLLIVTAGRNLRTASITIRALVAGLRTMHQHRRSVLTLAAPNPPTLRPPAISIAAGLLA